MLPHVLHGVLDRALETRDPGPCSSGGGRARGADVSIAIGSDGYPHDAHPLISPGAEFSWRVTIASA